jgi:hypothetical protein
MRRSNLNSTRLRRLALAAFGLVASVSSASLQAQTTIHQLTSDEAQRDCGCTFRVPSAQSAESQDILAWTYASTGRARLDGILLEFSSPEEVYRPIRKGRNSIGDRMSFLITKGPYRITGQCTASEVCKPADDSCEWKIYGAQIEVSGPRGVKRLLAQGVCGC